MDDLAMLNDETPIADTTAGDVALTEPVAAAAGLEAPPLDAATEPATITPDDPVPPAIEVEYPDEEPAVDPPDPTVAAPPDAAAAAPWGTAALEQWLVAHPDLQKTLAQDPAAQAQLLAMAQRSDELNVFQKTFATPAAAQAAAEAAGQLASLEKVYASGEQPEQFWQALYDAALVEGKPSGAYERNVRFLHEAFLDQLGARGLGDAAQAIRAGLKWAPPARPAAPATAPPLAADPAIPDHLRGRMAQADRDAAELRELRAGRERETVERNESFLNDTAADVASGLKDFVGGLLAGAKLSDYDKQNIARDFAEKVSELAAQDQAHSATLMELFKSGGPNPATRQRMAAKAQAWARQNGRGILEPILQRAGAGLKQRQADRAARPARAEPAAGGAVSDPRPPSARELVRAAERRHGKRLTDREILDLA